MADYDSDILEWSERQASLLRHLAAGKRLPANQTPDWANIIDEVESVGRSQLSAVRPLLVQALRHDLRAEAWPSSREVPHWRSEARGFRDDAVQAYTPSTRQELDVEALCAKALNRLPATVDGLPPRPPPATCPATLDDLLRE